MTRLLICTLGGFQARLRRSEEPLAFRTRKAMAVTAYLAIRGNGHGGRDELGEMLWGGVAPEQSRHSVRQAVLEIRRTFGTDANEFLVTTSEAVRFNPHSVRVDVKRFEKAVAIRTPRSIALACELYRGDFLAGLHVREPGFDHWVLNERNRLKQLAADALQLRIAFLADRGEISLALQTGLRLLELDPFHEWGHRAVMTAYARRGQFSAAWRHYETFAKRLKAELDVEPETETQELLRKLLRERGQPSPART